MARSIRSVSAIQLAEIADSDAWRLLHAVRHPRQFYQSQRQRRSVSPEGYTYSVFDANECIFVHVPKTAGVAISLALFGNLAGGHASIRDYQTIYPKAVFERYFRFTFVRNPWDRLLSAFRFLKSGGMNERDRTWAGRVLRPFATFDDFVCNWVTPENIETEVHFVPQYRFLLRRSGNMGVEFVGRYETLDRDFQVVADRLGLKAQLEAANQTRPPESRSDYRERYSPKAREVVAQVYRRDIELFEYRFDG